MRRRRLDELLSKLRKLRDERGQARLEESSLLGIPAEVIALARRGQSVREARGRQMDSLLEEIGICRDRLDQVTDAQAAVFTRAIAAGAPINPEMIADTEERRAYQAVHDATEALDAQGAADLYFARLRK